MPSASSASVKLIALDATIGYVELAAREKTRADQAENTTTASDFTIIPMNINSIETKMKVDSGADRSLLDDDLVVSIRDGEPILPNTFALEDINGEPVESSGNIDLKIDFKGAPIEQNFFITKGLTLKAVLGKDALVKHGIVINGRRQSVYIEPENHEFKEQHEMQLRQEIEQLKRELEKYKATEADSACSEPTEYHQINMVQQTDARPVVTIPKKPQDTGAKSKKTVRFIENPPTKLKKHMTEPNKIESTLKKEIRIAPGESKIIYTRLNQQVKSGTICHVSAVELPIELYLPESVTIATENNEIGVHVTNRSDCEQILAAKTTIAVVDTQVELVEKPFLEKENMENETAEVDEYFERFKLDQDCPELKTTLRKFVDLFVGKDEPTGRTNIVEHRIDTGGSPPIRQRAYRTPFSQKPRVQAEIKEMLTQEVISPSKSPWAAPVVMVLKKDGEYRFCIDYRKLNEVTKKDSFPLPRIDSTLDLLYGNRLFTTLDLARAYWQIAVHPADREKTAFIAENNLYEFNVMPFGLVNAPATFQRLINYVLRDLVGEICLVYLDDIIIFGKSLEEHLRNIETVFERIRGANLKLRPDKCSFLQTEVEFLGHLISTDGIKPDPKKIERVRDCRTPTTPREVKSFLGLAGYYRKFVEGFSKIAHSMIELTKDDVPFQWNDEAEAAFQTLKLRLITPPILAFPNPDVEFIVFTDASEFGIGAVLGQIQGKKEVVIAYFSRHLNATEIKYSTVEKECLALIDAVKRFRSYVLGRHFTLITDHRPLEWLRTVKDNNKRLIRWSLELAEHNFTIKYRPGRIHSNADGMSRLGIAAATQLDREPAAVESDESESENTRIEGQTPRILELQKEDELCREISYYLINKRLKKDEYGETPPDPFWLVGIALFKFDEEGILVRELHSANKRGRQTIRLQTVAPVSIRKPLMTAMHDVAIAGHLGYHKTYERVKSKYYWPRMSIDIKAHCETCAKCQLRKPPGKRRRSALYPLEPVHNPFDRIAMDLIGPLNETMRHNKYILTVMDYFTRYAEAIPITDKSAQTVANAVLRCIFFRYGMAKVLLTDNGGEFVASYFEDICRLLKVKRVTTTAYRPQTDGLTERFNKTLMQMVTQFVNDYHDDWDAHVQEAVFAYNTSTQSSIMETPHYLMHGWDPNMPIDVLLDIPARQYTPPDDYKANLVRRMASAYRLARENTIDAQAKQKAMYDEKITTRDYHIGDRVYMTEPVLGRGLTRKLAYCYKGPYRVINRFPGLVYEVKSASEKQSQLVHLDRIKPCKETVPWDESSQEKADLEAEVEIINVGTKGNKYRTNVRPRSRPTPVLHPRNEIGPVVESVSIDLSLNEVENSLSEPAITQWLEITSAADVLPEGRSLTEPQVEKPVSQTDTSPEITPTDHLAEPPEFGKNIIENSLITVEPTHKSLRSGLRPRKRVGAQAAHFNPDFEYYT